MIDSQHRLSNRNKGSFSRKPLIGATVYYNLPFVQLWYKICNSAGLFLKSSPYSIDAVVTALRWRTSPNRFLEMKSSHGWRQTGFQRQPSQGYQVSSTRVDMLSPLQRTTELELKLLSWCHALLINKSFFSDDLLDGDDLVVVCEDDKECRFYFPEFKERSRFKSLVKAEEENQVRAFIIFPRKPTSLPSMSLPENFESVVLNRACQTLGGRLSTEILHTAIF